MFIPQNLRKIVLPSNISSEKIIRQKRMFLDNGLKQDQHKFALDLIYHYIFSRYKHSYSCFGFLWCTTILSFASPEEKEETPSNILVYCPSWMLEQYELYLCWKQKVKGLPQIHQAAFEKLCFWVYWVWFLSNTSSELKQHALLYPNDQHHSLWIFHLRVEESNPFSNTTVNHSFRRFPKFIISHFSITAFGISNSQIYALAVPHPTNHYSSCPYCASFWPWDWRVRKRCSLLYAQFIIQVSRFSGGALLIIVKLHTDLIRSLWKTSKTWRCLVRLWSEKLLDFSINAWFDWRPSGPATQCSDVFSSQFTETWPLTSLGVFFGLSHC